MIDLSFFHKIITERISELDAARLQSDNSGLSVELDQSKVGRLSRMDAMQMQQMDLELKRRQQIELLALGHALKRVDDEEYGECMECGEEINPKRLEIDLVATLCITCAQKRENS